MAKNKTSNATNANNANNASNQRSSSAQKKPFVSLVQGCFALQCGITARREMEELWILN